MSVLSELVGQALVADKSDTKGTPDGPDWVDWITIVSILIFATIVIAVLILTNK